jgi:starvation-inducible DNA-binding protein
MESSGENSLTGKARDTLARILGHLLADECSLSATTRDYRWRVTGPNLYSLHRLFEEQRRQLDYWLDQLLERTRSVGLALAGGGERNSPGPGAGDPQAERLEPRSMIGDLLERHEEMARTLREDIDRLGDPVTAQLLTRLLEFHETSAWMLRMLHDGPLSSRS